MIRTLQLFQHLATSLQIKDRLDFYHYGTHPATEISGKLYVPDLVFKKYIIFVKPFLYFGNR